LLGVWRIVHVHRIPIHASTQQRDSTGTLLLLDALVGLPPPSTELCGRQTDLAEHSCRTREVARLRPENFPHPRPGTRVHRFGHTTESTSMSVTLLLGSASTSRATILTRAGIPYTQLASDIHETALVTDVSEPRAQAHALPT